MKLRHLVSPLVTLAVLGGGGYAAYRTQDRWLPHVFPIKAVPSGEHAGHDHDHGPRADRVKLSPQAQQTLGLDADTLTPREFWRTKLIPGVVIDRPGESDRGVTARVAGVVTAIRARPGDTVTAGDPLFTLQLASEFLQTAQTELIRTGKEREFAVLERDRIAALVAKGTTAEADLLKQRNVVDRLSAQRTGIRRQLLVFGLTPEQVDRVEAGEVITELTVVAPPDADGPTRYEVQELKTHLGEQVPAGQTLCLLSSHQRLYVEGRAFKSEADALAVAAERGTPVRAEFADETPGAWSEQGPLTVHHLANEVDPVTRTFGVYLSLDNQSRTFTRDGRTFFVWRYRPGQRVRLHLPIERLVGRAADGNEVLPFVLPAGAVVREGGEAFVFVQSGDVFVRKPVRLLYADRTDAVIANDGSVTEAEYVVRNQAAALNRAVKAQAAGGGHGHDHGHEH